MYFNSKLAMHLSHRCLSNRHLTASSFQCCSSSRYLQRECTDKPFKCYLISKYWSTIAKLAAEIFLFTVCCTNGPASLSCPRQHT